MNVSTKKKYMRPKEVAEYMRISIVTVWRYAKEGKLNPRKISPRVTVFNIDEIENLINGMAK